MASTYSISLPRRPCDKAIPTFSSSCVAYVYKDNTTPNLVNLQRFTPAVSLCLCGAKQWGVDWIGCAGEMDL